MIEFFKNKHHLNHRQAQVELKKARLKLLTEGEEDIDDENDLDEYEDQFEEGVSDVLHDMSEDDNRKLFGWCQRYKDRDPSEEEKNSFLQAMGGRILPEEMETRLTKLRNAANENAQTTSTRTKEELLNNFFNDDTEEDEDEQD
eukprot:TRINITY_DN22253_c0_g1_i1.p1 TRINITY_DN22253_c0_g1~~TRINITY_DN22253_c0_g1_i1.p1  ORF type:complete len:161 (+),score=75.76 TRINITY_DN22253_c0_g1_i1:53-484(+)